MIYFDNAATSLPKPDEVRHAVVEALTHSGNPARGAHGPSLNGLRTLGHARQLIADTFGVTNPCNVAFTSGATAALNLAIGGLEGHIITTAAEHNSVLRPVYRHGNYTIVPVDGLGRLDMAQLEAAIQPDTAAVVITHASNLTGNVFDIATAGIICQMYNLLLVVDAAQTAGLLPIDMQKTGISALCFSGHKSLLGPQGTGALCLSPSFLPPPLLVGGSGSHSFSSIHPATMPDRLEAGTQNVHGIAGLAAGIGYVLNQNGACFAKADALARRFHASIQGLGYQLYGDLGAKVRTPIVTLRHPRIDSAELADQLYSSHEIAVRAGAHCAPLMHRALGTETTGAVRFSFSHLNTAQEVDFAVEVLASIDKRAW